MDGRREAIARICYRLKELKKSTQDNEIHHKEVQNYLDYREYKRNGNYDEKTTVYFLKKWPIGTSVVILTLTVIASFVFGILSRINQHRCAISNNFVVMELSRPATNCDICKGVNEVKVFHNVSKNEFLKYAYSSRPMLVTGATKTWSAPHAFSFQFFKRIYEETEGAYRSVEEECMFFPFKTSFQNLQDVLQMSLSRANMITKDSKPWYIGWSNCNPTIQKILRQHYKRPHFLPDGSEHSVLDWIFMGWSGQGTSMHLDYVQRPSWQAQISGVKSWNILPPPECEDVCNPMNVTVHTGDIILLDTNQWYHETFIHPGSISITIGSEYD